MKRSLSGAIALFLCAAVLFLPAVSAENDAMNWYCKKVTDHQRPECPFDEGMLKENGAFYLGNDEKVLYLTFDAGYSNENVETIVQVLKDHEVTGAFFLLKHFVQANPQLVKLLSENGNLVCNHTMNHPNLSRLSPEEIQKELLGLEELTKEVTGQAMAKFFRPPEGSFSEEALRTVNELGYRTVFWSVAYADWDNNNQPSEAEAMEKLLSRIHNGAVILLHPTSRTNAAILDRLLTVLKEQGYRFGSLEEIV